ncbi:HAD-IA family hydrolase [Candidatus Saccharibacteria bacterium]|jgi:epoxide hydrolase-like predicted phosphatase|nr:HAD-IA family hydrolase [Candidatus Saccharibacteria bacterium]
MIKAIIFDCFGVLFRSSLDHIRSITPSERLEELEDYRIQHDRGYINQDNFLRHIADIIDWPVQKVKSYMRSEHILNDELVGCISELKKEYKIGLLTNVGQGWLDEMFPAGMLENLFDSVVESSTVGIVKPEPEIYQHSARTLGLDTKECCFIDDSLRNVEGAKNVGMEVILYTTNQSTIERLNQLGVNSARIT